MDCGVRVRQGNRCQPCLTIFNRVREQSRPHRNRPHYTGNYRGRAATIRAEAEVCWICGDTTRPDDPWTADHLIPGDPDSPLAPAHRSCNSRRGQQHGQTKRQPPIT
jgi:hypothetical protein